ncbi:ABC transporter ATP-binding protein [Dubosiella newyorkensis]|uniref:ABC transporter domain-containing protein n=3 Tax=Dubosiella newyorkensis TaxID=1862672 RepID=A0A1U7NKH8_9FIRM|nr:ABC transporter ATP-binding protein [Dubosiella newyorkensis]OLU44755.1 hypothetical protein BO225_09920 [Dubosiella newyorkensis]
MIQITKITKKYDKKEVLHSISLDIPAGKRFVLFGPSGAGKSTLLKLIAGLESPTSGTIIKESNKIAMVFQNDLLFDHLTTFDNIAYGLDHRQYTKEEITKKVKMIAARTRTASYLDKKAAYLSGGERQRVALARALVSNPEILLLDEAFSHLNPALKKELLIDLIDFQKSRNMTLISVSHDFQEAQFLGEILAALDQGNLVQIDSPFDIFEHPQSIDVANSLDLIGINTIYINNKVYGIRPCDCSFQKREYWICYGTFTLEFEIPYEDSTLFVGKIANARFCVLESKKEALLKAPVYLDPSKIIAFED